MNEDFRDLLFAMLDAGARFLVVGAHALAVHGVPRATGDLDLWVEPTPDNARRVAAALERFGAPLAALRLSPEDLLLPDQVVQFGLPPRRVDLLTGISGVTFAEAWDRRASTKVEGQAVPVIGRADLVANKRATGRQRDLGDLEALGEVPSRE
jgi:hypothetical protein